MLVCSSLRDPVSVYTLLWFDSIIINKYERLFN